MSKFIIKGGNSLYGRVRVQGAKNTILPLLAATVLTGDICTIHNCPNLTDVDVSVRILECLGCRVVRENNSITVDSSTVTNYVVPDSLMREMRSSIVFLGAIASRFGNAVMSNPGGCELGPRPIDIHLSSLKKMGMIIDEVGGSLVCSANKTHGAEITLPLPSVGATENILLAAVSAKGTTKIINAAREPEITDLGNFLIKCGAKIYGHGTSVITVQGVKKLHGTDHTAITDRIVTGTYMSAVASAGGKILIENAVVEDIAALISVLQEMGCNIKNTNEGLLVECNSRPKSIEKISTMYYPGFPTDAGTPILSVMSVADGTSVLVENIFECRFRSVDELIKMGASINVCGKMAVVKGVKRLHGARVFATDLRAGAALVIAGLNAEGITELEELKHIDRGYENLEIVLESLGAEIKRID